MRRWALSGYVEVFLVGQPVLKVIPCSCRRKELSRLSVGESLFIHCSLVFLMSALFLLGKETKACQFVPFCLMSPTAGFIYSKATADLTQMLIMVKIPNEK